MIRGSIWRKWDLHIHTPASFHHEFGFINEEENRRYQSNLWDKYIDELENISNVAVIGITDYFTLDGYKKVLEYKAQGRLKNFELILPNIEFRLDKIVDKRKLNYHVIFSDEIDVNEIEKEFLEPLTIKFYKGEIRQLIKKNIEEVGRIIKQDQGSFKGKSEYIVGCENIAVSEDEIRDVLEQKKSVFAGKYLLVLPEEGWCEISWTGQGYLIKRELLAKSHALFSSNPNTRDWALGKKDESREEIENKFGSLKPCIHGSDAHSFERLCKPDEDRFCWIKADCTFEGLKQIVYEPEDRVGIHPENPEYRKSIYTLSSMAIKNSYINPELSIEEGEMGLNGNLVIVTGGKGDGKTAFLELIANCFQDRCKTGERDRNSFVQRIEDEKPDLEVEITFTGEGGGGFSKELIEEKFFGDSTITYLPQGKIEEYSGDREKLDKKIEEIIFGSKEVMDGGYRERFDKLRGEIDELTEKVDEINLAINELEQETDQEVIKEVERKKHIRQGDLNNKKNELKKLTETMEKGIKEKISNLKKEHTELQVKHSRFESLGTELEEFRSQLSESVETLNTKIDELNLELSELVGKLVIPPLDFDPQKKGIKIALDLVARNKSELTKQIKERHDQLNKLSGVERSQAELLKEIENINADIKSLKKQLEILDQKKEKIKSLEVERESEYCTLLKKYFEWKSYYEEVIEVFSKGKSEIMHGIDFESTIHFAKSRFVQLGLDVLDMRKINEEDIEKCAADLEGIISEGARGISVEKVRPFTDKILEKKKYLKETRSNYDLYKWIFDNYFSLSTKIYFNQRVMEKLSIGQKGTVLLKLFLAEGDYPLIIDQPDENLDNRFIYSELVGAIRDAKKKRQVVLATNNGNLVVNTDAEQIIVAKFENNIISYGSSTLENLGTREDIMSILEGGKEAFRRREQKYGI